MTVESQPVGLLESRVADVDVDPSEALLEVKNLRTSFFTADGAVHAAAKPGQSCRTCRTQGGCNTR